MSEAGVGYYSQPRSDTYDRALRRPDR
jgi:hypothetical protein